MPEPSQPLCETRGHRPGDKIWIDRSRSTLPTGPAHRYPSDNQVESYAGGWKQCGPFNRVKSDYVHSWHYAIRGCMRPADGRPSVCGRWIVDQ
ncbi:hypothetical protein HS041_09725 [Planomonospora sp. ID67723]|uniref:hypothetical protein n=1 Tax=Planomonospora sp. ID67723 TaxID=2738134 RepID=UPI0018C41D3D|nr:hypothetical protein [Planomonospora sp. ID67723]MBG0828045.1 hypothetical protein [Planomonospora sp. ID67723]